MFVLKNEGRREDKKLGIWGAGVAHGRATTGTGRAKLLVFCGFARNGQARPCQASSILAQIFFLLFS